MAGKNPESVLTVKIRKAIEATYPGVKTHKIAAGPYGAGGLPDLLCLLPPYGRAVWLEVKCPKPGESRFAAAGRVTERQQLILDRMQVVGCGAYVVISVEESVSVISAELLKNP